MGTAHLGQLTLRRKLALGLALLWLVVFVAFVFLAALHPTPGFATTGINVIRRARGSIRSIGECAL